MNAPWPNGKSAGYRKERLGGWFSVMLEVNLPWEEMVRTDETRMRASWAYKVRDSLRG